VNSSVDDTQTGVRKAAILLVLLGDDAAMGVYKNLSESEVRLVTQEITDLGYISPEIAAKVLQEYHHLTLTQEYVTQGGAAYAHKVLTKAFGEEETRNLLELVGRAKEDSAQDMDTLHNTDPQQLAKFIQGEHPQTIALVLAHLDTRSARGVLMLLPEKVRGLAVKPAKSLRTAIWPVSSAACLAAVVHPTMSPPGSIGVGG